MDGENDDGINTLTLPMGLPPALANAKPAFSDTDDDAAETDRPGAMDHNKETLKQKKKEEKQRRKAEKAEKAAAKAAAKEAAKEAKDAEKRAAAERKAASKAPPPLPPGAIPAAAERTDEAARPTQPPPPPPPPATLSGRPPLAVQTSKAAVSPSRFSFMDPPSPSMCSVYEAAPAAQVAAAGPSEPAAPETVDRWVTTLLEGDNMTKFGSMGKGKMKFCIVNKEGAFFWSDSTGKTINSIRLLNVKSVLKGKQTKVLRRKTCAGIDEERCFSIVTNKRTVDLVASAREVRDLWVDALIYGRDTVRQHGKVMLHDITTTEMQRCQNELNQRIAELEAERRRQSVLLHEKEQRLAESEATAAELLATKERVAADLERAQHERHTSHHKHNEEMDRVRDEIRRLQELHDEEVKRMAHEKDQMTQLINESQQMLAKAKTAIHRRTVSSAQHRAEAEELGAKLQSMMELSATAAVDAEEHQRKVTASQELLEDFARKVGHPAAGLDDVDEAGQAAAPALPPVPPPVAAGEEADVVEEPSPVLKAQPSPAPAHSRGHRSTISFAEVLTPAVWQPDEASKNCMKCTSSFHFFRRRHHCRKCGLLVCGSCSSKKAKIEETCDKVRVCDGCIAEHGFKAE